MGCAASSTEDKFNKKIQDAQKFAAREQVRSMKILLLGTGDSGKTTLRKQMRNLYGEGFSPAARKQMSNVVMGNLIDGTREVLGAYSILGMTLEPELAPYVQVINEISGSPPALSNDVAQAFIKVIQSDSFQVALKKKNAFQLQDCWQSFADSLINKFPQWGGEDWIPSDADCVSVRVRTSGIVEEQLKIDGVHFNIFDVGGQRAERRKWIHAFDNVTAVLFITAISEYDQVLFEDRTRNRLEEALELFEEICNSRWFVSIAMMLFLNKKDLFEKKFLVDKVPLNTSGKFPDAPGNNGDAKVAIDWITKEFLKRNKHTGKEIYTYVTTATDPQNVRAVFDVVRSIILKANLMNSGFVVNGLNA